jgi:PPOX class probable F420-dependent enzyme
MSRFDPARLPPEVLAFLTERHLATLTTLRPDGTPHVTPVGFTYEPDRRLARIITFAGAAKVRNLTAQPGGAAVICQVEGGRWLTLEGPAEVTSDPERNRQGVDRYAARYRQPNDRPDRVTIELTVQRVLGRV